MGYKWEKQFSVAMSKANEILGMIKCSFSDRSKEIVIPLSVLSKVGDFVTL